MKLAAASDPVAEVLWYAGFAAIRPVVRSRVSRCVPGGGRRVLVIAPHPDDETVGCAGTILLHIMSGDTVCLAFVTDGSKSRAGGLDPGQMRRRREKEAQAAAGALRVNRYEWFGLMEGGWTFDQLRTPLLNLLRQVSPQIIYAPSRVDFHPEHHKVAHGLARLLSGEGIDLSHAILRVYQLQVPLTPILTNQVVDCSSVSEKAEAALNVYASQSANLGRAVRMRRYSALLYGFRKYGEEYWQMPAGAYCRLHCSPPDQWNTARFRGIRYRSFSDPLAYISGIPERMHLRKISESSLMRLDAPCDT